MRANANIDLFRRQLAQAQAEQRERFLPGAAGVLHGGIGALTAQGLGGASASDLMRLATPVRDSDQGDTVSGSGNFQLIFRNEQVLNQHIFQAKSSNARFVSVPTVTRRISELTFVNGIRASVSNVLIVLAPSLATTR